MAKNAKIIGLVAGLLVLLTACSDSLGDRYVSFAQCLTDNQVVMYGAYWCPHCSNQKKFFGKEAFKQVNYVECDPRGEDAKPRLCLEKDVQSYPTWVFADGSRVTGEQRLESLADRSGCPLPGDEFYGSDEDSPEESPE